MSALLEAHVLEHGIQLGVLGARSLPQTVEGLAEVVDLSFFSGNSEVGYTSCLRLLLRKADLTSMWWTRQPS
jgi:hypothetical protein